MDAIDEATGVLRDAEQKLRSILVKAAERGDYDHLPQIAEWAKLLASLPGQTVTAAAPARSLAVLPAPADNGVHERVPEARTRPAASGTRAARGGRRSKKPARAKSKKAGYPQFVREGDSLVKIAWSKSEGKPYEHKAPKAVLRALIQALTRAGAGGERFTMEALLPLKDLTDSSDIPDYQAYVTLAWLRSVGLIVQHGRQGYSLPDGVDLNRESDRHWNDLKSR